MTCIADSCVVTGDEQDAQKVDGCFRSVELLCATIVTITPASRFQSGHRRCPLAIQPLATESRLLRTPTAALASPHPYSLVHVDWLLHARVPTAEVEQLISGQSDTASSACMSQELDS